MKSHLLLVLIVCLTLGMGAQNEPSVAWVHKATGNNTINNYSQADSDTINGDGTLLPIFTHSYNLNGSAGKYVLPKQGLWYFGGKWRIFNEDGSSLKLDTYYNILKPGDDMEAWKHTTKAENISFNQTTISHPSIDENPDAIILISDKWEGKYNVDYQGVYYSASAKKWKIYNQAGVGKAMQQDLKFNVVVAKQSNDYKAFSVKSVGANTSGHILKLDDPELNYNPNAVLFITQNYNPGGIGGVYNNHPVGVYYNGSKWCIYNEDLAALPDGAAFNVIAFPNIQSTSVDNQINHTDVKIFPNPASTDELLYLNLNKEMEGPVEVRIFSITGEQVFARNFTSGQEVHGYGISLNGLNRGMYLVKVKNNDRTGMQRLIIN